MITEVNRQAFDKHLEKCFQSARETLEQDPAAQLAPWLAIATAKEEDDLQSGNWQIHRVKFRFLDERRYALLKSLGADYGMRRQMVVAVYLVSEAWVSIMEAGAREAHPENRIPPSEDPDRLEAILVAGMDITAHVAIIQALIDRDATGHARLQQPTRIDDGSGSDLLKTFMGAFALAYLKAGGKL